MAWRLQSSDREDLHVGWSAWLKSITKGYFGEQAASSLYRSATLSGVTEAAATLTAAAVTNCAPRKSKRCARSAEPISLGTRASVHDVMAESLANAAIDMGRSFNKTLNHVSPIVATDAVSSALLDALVEHLNDSDGSEVTSIEVRGVYLEVLRRKVPAI